jgi:3-hydroxyisobutyrate dehydrogenase-like beta-hydroxyacid dehydrogenase
MLADAPAVEAVVFGPDGLATGMEPGSVLVEMSTIGPEAVHAIAERLPEGVELVDAPVKGGPARAEKGELKILVGGSDGAVDRASPVLCAMGSPVPLGPLGTGAAAKVLNNFAVIVLVSALGEAMALADALELREDLALEILGGTPLAPTIDRQWERVTEQRGPSFRLGLAAKDLAIGVDALRTAGIEPGLGRTALARLRRAADSGMAALDLATVVRAIRSQGRSGP